MLVTSHRGPCEGSCEHPVKALRGIKGLYTESSLNMMFGRHFVEM